jgi:hypothetical protein
MQDKRRMGISLNDRGLEIGDEYSRRIVDEYFVSRDQIDVLHASYLRRFKMFC